MKLSTKGQYAIKAMLKLAINFDSNPITLVELTSYQNISLSYLEQLFSKLSNSGLVQGVRGPNGGYRLGRAPDLISIKDIILVIEEPNSNTHSDEDSNHEKSEFDIANNIWNEFSEQLSVYLNSVTLADLIEDHTVKKTQYHLDETTRRISTMFPVTDRLKTA